MINFKKKGYKFKIESLIIASKFEYNYYLIKIRKNQTIFPNISLKEEENFIRI